eukprot:TRINITY_DN78_c1_g2_i1.p1 TRINITY_DN78_c1_g2~~TRINITY_DN78_c1_g2_i1.p1  ORF type:complete len:386 (-),score=144.96 TRINITY_DN78_c1_g2_i1:829-1986(-)
MRRTRAAKNQESNSVLSSASTASTLSTAPTLSTTSAKTVDDDDIEVEISQESVQTLSKLVEELTPSVSRNDEKASAELRVVLKKLRKISNASSSLTYAFEDDLWSSISRAEQVLNASAFLGSPKHEKPKTSYYGGAPVSSSSPSSSFPSSFSSSSTSASSTAPLSPSIRLSIFKSASPSSSSSSSTTPSVLPSSSSSAHKTPPNKLIFEKTEQANRPVRRNGPLSPLFSKKRSHSNTRKTKPQKSDQVKEKSTVKSPVKRTTKKSTVVKKKKKEEAEEEEENKGEEEEKESEEQPKKKAAKKTKVEVVKKAKKPTKAKAKAPVKSKAKGKKKLKVDEEDEAEEVRKPTNEKKPTKATAKTTTTKQTESAEEDVFSFDPYATVSVA